MRSRRMASQQLQWGHALSGMDTWQLSLTGQQCQHASMGPCPFRHGYSDSARRLVAVAAVLQWGHALSGMDTWSRVTGIVGPVLASMGPCPFRHGYPGQEDLDFLSRCRLQWGHALSGMDTKHAGLAVPTSSPCFNGAMPFQAWIL